MKRASHFHITVLATAFASALPAPGQDCTNPNWTVLATGLTNPRHMHFGPDGLLYVAEAGIGGTLLGTCDWEGNLFNQAGPYMGGYSGRISRIHPDGTRETVADGLPGFVDGFGDALGASDLTWIDCTLYALIEGGGCTRGLPNDPSGIVRINADGSYAYVADITAFIRANPVMSEPPCGPEGDCEPDGVPHSLLAQGNRLLVVETNHNSILRVNPRTGAIARLYDLSVQDPAPIKLVQRGRDYYLGGFDGLIQTFDRNFGPVTTFDEGYSAIVDMTFVGNKLYILETFAPDMPWTPHTGRVIRRNRDGSRTVVACGLNFPIGMARGARNFDDDRVLFVSTNCYGQGPFEGQGEIVRIELPRGRDRDDDHDGDLNLGAAGVE